MASKSKKVKAPKKSTSTLPQIDWALVFKIISGVGAVLLAWFIGAAALQKAKSTAQPQPVFTCQDREGYSTLFCGKHMMAMKPLDDSNAVVVQTSKPSAFDQKTGVAQTSVDVANKTSYLPVHEHIVNAIIEHQPQRVLLLGLGGGAIPLLLTSRYPDCEFVGVDLYQDSLTITRKFVLADDGKKIQYVRADAKKYMAEAATESFDVVISDIYQGAYLPEFVLEDEFISNVKRVMRDDAIYIADVFAPEGTTDRFIRMYMALRKWFPSVDMSSPPESKASFVFTSSKIEPPEPEDEDEHDHDHDHDHGDHDHVHGEQCNHDHDHDHDDSDGEASNDDNADDSQPSSSDDADAAKTSEE